MNTMQKLELTAMAVAVGALTGSSAFAEKGGKKPPPPPLAGWEVTILQPPTEDYHESFALGVSGGQQAGYAITTDGYDHAGVWSGTAGSWLNLHPTGAMHSVAYAAGGGQEVGVAFMALAGGYWLEHASLWSGTAQSWVDLHPAQCEISRAYATDGTRQVGAAGSPPGMTHASLWSGTAESWVDLHPYDSGWGYSCAYGICGNQVVGDITGSGERAILWKVEPDGWSWLDLHPPKASISVAYDVSDGQQVGSVDFAIVKGRRLQGYVRHASLWSGTAESWVDLHPKGYNQSEARGISHGYQAGSAQVDSFFDIWHAGMWSGTPGSWVDLHAFLPTEYIDSEAQDIEVTDTDVWVVGYASNSMWQTRAVLWHKKLSE
jgi:hypothetical protein